MNAFLPDELDLVLSRIDCGDLSDAAGASALQAELDEHFGDSFDEGIRERALAGTLTDQGGGTLLFGRHFGPKDNAFRISCDAVVMDGEAPEAAEHIHDGGEVVRCVALEGEPTFDGMAPGWIVFPEGHRHRPKVEGGRMAMIYFWPGGRATFPNRKKS